MRGVIFESDSGGHKAERVTPPWPRYGGPGTRFCLAPGVRVQWPRHARRLAGSPSGPSALRRPTRVAVPMNPV